MTKHRSRTNSLSSRTSNGSTSKQQRTLSKSDSLASITDSKTPVILLQVPTPTKSHHSKSSKPKPLKMNTDDTLLSDSKMEDESELIARHCRESEFFRDLTLIQQAIVNSTPKTTPKVDFTLDDLTMTEDLTDMTPTKDSIHVEPSTQHDMSMQADRAAILLIKVLLVVFRSM